MFFNFWGLWALPPAENRGFWQKRQKWRVCILQTKTRFLVLRTPKATSMAGVTQAKPWFTESGVSEPRSGCFGGRDFESQRFCVFEILFPPQPPELQQWKEKKTLFGAPWRIFRAFFCGHFPWKLTKISEKLSQNFAAFFADLLQKLRKNFALGDCGPKKSQRFRDAKHLSRMLIIICYFGELCIAPGIGSSKR